MSWFIVELTKEEQEIVHQECQLHPNLKIRERMNIIWYLHNQRWLANSEARRGDRESCTPSSAAAPSLSPSRSLAHVLGS